MPAGTIPFLAWQIVIETGVNDDLVFDENGGLLGPWTCTIPPGTYYWGVNAGDGEFSAAVETAINLIIGPTNNYLFTPNLLTGALDFQADGGGVNSRLLFGSAGTTLDPAVLGCNAATKTLVGGPVYTATSDFQIGRAWFPEQIYVDDSEDLPVYTSSQRTIMDGSTVTALWGEYRTREITIDVLPANKVFSGDERAGHAQEAWLAQVAGQERPSAWIATGETFAFVPDYSVPTTYGLYKPMGRDWISTQPFATSVPGLRRYDLSIPMVLV